MKKSALIIIAILIIIIAGFAITTRYSNSIYNPPGASQNNAAKMMTDPQIGQYLTDPKGMTLYIFTKDTPGVSNCNGNCSVIWPPYSTKYNPANLPAGIGTISRDDGTKQYTWKKMPLYYFSGDKKAGDLNGQGIQGLWYAAK